jgi:hypothetical protein
MAFAAFDAVDPRFRGVLKGNTWTLCVGAGICMGVMPSWAHLTREVLNATMKVSLDEASFTELVRRTGWGFDAWIQTALNAHLAAGGDADAFAAVVEEVLYRDLRAKALAKGVERSIITAFNSPHLLRKEEFEKLFPFITRMGATAVPLARLLILAVRQHRSPRAIITFNYDTILETVIRMIEIKSHSKHMGSHMFPEASFRRVTGPSSGLGAGVPIYHIHGSVTPKASRSRRRTPHDTRDGIVGPESSYLQLAGSVFAWAQTTFLHHAQTDALVLVGHSLSDPNLRRWLAWSAGVRNADTSRLAGKPVQLLPHVWFGIRPTNASEEEIMSNALTHLGVRVAWIDSWRKLSAGLSNLLALA